MSQENVEIVRELYAGWVRGDFSVGREHFDPDNPAPEKLPRKGPVTLPLNKLRRGVTGADDNPVAGVDRGGPDVGAPTDPRHAVPAERTLPAA